MNSKQRRKEKRDIDKNYHKVHLTICPGMDWSEWSDRVAEMVRWANEHAGRKYWLKKDEWRDSTFYFNEGKDATMFILKWS